MFRLKLVKDETGFDFFGNTAKYTFGLSAVLVVASLVIYLFDGLNYGIDFRGGTMITVATVEEPDVGGIRQSIGQLGLGDSAVTRVYDPAGELSGATPNQVSIRIEQSDDDPQIQLAAITSVKDALSAAYPGIQFLQTDSVGAKVSGELIFAGIVAVLAAVGAVLFYIWLRFEWQFAVGAVAALIHDVALTIGVFSLVGLEFNLAIIAAILTIVGYSLNDTVVVFDRVRENLRKFKKTELKDVLNMSINETLSRTFMTSATTLVALIALFVFGGDVIRGFTFAMIWGVVVGTYSSIFVASAILLRLGVDRDGGEGSKAGTQFANVDA
jgi:preprotein translocase SecF subunit